MENQTKQATDNLGFKHHSLLSRYGKKTGFIGNIYYKCIINLLTINLNSYMPIPFSSVDENLPVDFASA